MSNNYLSNVLSAIAICLTIISTILIVGKCHYNKNIDNISCEIIYISLLIAIIWSIYGFIENKYNIFIGNVIITILLLYLLYLYYKYV